MYLSRLKLNPQSRRARAEVANPYEMHRTIMHAFPDAQDGGPGRVLYRLDVEKQTGAITLIAQSDKQPDWDFLNDPNATGYLLQDIQDNPSWKKFDPSVFIAGTSLRFRLRANPTVKRDGKRRAIIREEDQISWLRRKAEADGFNILGVRITPENALYGRKENNKLLLNSVLFDGVLYVMDSDAFALALAAGIGSGKGFGFGMLSIAKM